MINILDNDCDENDENDDDDQMKESDIVWSGEVINNGFLQSALPLFRRQSLQRQEEMRFFDRWSLAKEDFEEW